MNYDFRKNEIYVLWMFILFYMLSKVMLGLLGYTNTMIHLSITTTLCFMTLIALVMMEKFYEKY